jgi:hypothetical protein
MQAVSRLHSLRFDPVSRRYQGEVALTRADGREERVSATVIGHPRWPHERIARLLIGAARLQHA